jgi:hypothetical protein
VIMMSELYVPLSQVLDLINITNAANGFSDYHAYLDLYDAVENLPTILKEGKGYDKSSESIFTL